MNFSLMIVIKLPQNEENKIWDDFSKRIVEAGKDIEIKVEWTLGNDQKIPEIMDGKSRYLKSGLKIASADILGLLNRR